MVTHSAPLTLQQLLPRLEAHSERAVIVLSADGSLVHHTFGELAEAVNALVAQLRRVFEPGTRVGLLAANSFAWIVWDLALCATRMVSVALPSEVSNALDQDIFERYGLSLLATDREAMWTQPRTVPIDVEAAMRALSVALAPPRNTRVTSLSSDCLSMVFSSGTTGKTKGLLISRRGSERVIQRYADAFPPRHDDRHLVFIPFSNFQQRIAYYGCLLHGIDLVVTSLQRLFVDLRTTQPTFVIAPPILYESLQAMTERGEGVDATASHLRQLLGGRMRYMITGMAPTKRATLEFFARHGVELYEAYGCTETGVVAWNRPGCSRLGTVGTAIEPGSLELSADGEIIVETSAPLALGYFDATEAEMSRVFLSDTRIATGDIGAIDEAGFLRISGRIKDVIVTSDGRKLHPESIEALLERHPSIQTAVVFATETDELAAVLLVRGAPAGEQVAREVRAHVAAINRELDALLRVERVAITDVPFSAENRLRTANLKLDRRAIRGHFSAELGAL